MTYAICKTFLEDKLKKISEESNFSPDEAFLKYCYSILFNKSLDDIDDEDVIEGSYEKQIDVIRIEETNENLVDINIIQCKNETGFSSNSLICLKNGLKWILEESDENYSKIKNINFVNKIKEIRELIQEKGFSNVSIKLFFITKGDTENISEEFEQEKKDLDNMKKFGFRDFEFNIWGAKEIVEHITKVESLDKVINQNINIVYDINTPSIINLALGDYKGLICTVKASEIARLIDEDKKGVIFNKNIRKFLGSKKKINKSIYESCTNEKDAKLFWFLNNGITMICDFFDPITLPENPHIKVKNLQIVNGCQTSKTLHNAFINSKLQEKTSVLVRLYATNSDDQAFLDKITLATNNQNKIGFRDLKSNDPIQDKLQKVFLTKYNVNYERKVNEFAPKIKNKINNERIAQAFLSFGRKLPSLARSQPNTIWGNEYYYDSVFRRSTPAQLLFCYKLYEFCNNIKKEQVKKYKELENEIAYSTVAYGTFHLVRIIGFLCLGSEKFSSEEELDKRIKEIEQNPKILMRHYKIAFKVLNEILKENKDKYTTPTNFYKSHEIGSLINSKLKSLKI